MRASAQDVFAGMPLRSCGKRWPYEALAVRCEDLRVVGLGCFAPDEDSFLSRRGYDFSETWLERFGRMVPRGWVVLVVHYIEGDGFLGVVTHAVWGEGAGVGPRGRWDRWGRGGLGAFKCEFRARWSRGMNGAVGMAC